MSAHKRGINEFWTSWKIRDNPLIFINRDTLKFWPEEYGHGQYYGLSPTHVILSEPRVLSGASSQKNYVNCRRSLCKMSTLILLYSLMARLILLGALFAFRFHTQTLHNCEARNQWTKSLSLSLRMSGNIPLLVCSFGVGYWAMTT